MDFLQALTKQSETVITGGTYKLNYYLKQVPGALHVQLNAPCEDVSFIRRKTGFEFFGLADGQTGKCFSRLGAKTALNAAADCLERADRISANLTEIRYALAKEISGRLFEVACAKQNNNQDHGRIPFDEFASTITCIAIDSASGNYIALNLGDGVICAVQGETDIDLISGPERGSFNYGTFLTSSRPLLPHLRVCSGNIYSPYHAKILLLTDGATAIYQNGFHSEAVKKYLLETDIFSLSKLLEDSKPTDDASFLLLT